MDAPRRYHSPVRDAEAARTRGLIVDAAAALFARDGYAATPMKAIATEAGVSVQSVHLAGPKSALMLAAFERTFAGDEGRHSLTERPVLAAILEEPDLDVAMRAYVDFLTEANQRAAPVWSAFRAAADADPAVRELYVDIEERRMRDMRLGAAWAVSRGLVPESGAGRAADVLALITGPDTFLHFVGNCGWSLEDYRAWVARSIRVLLDSGA
ncbi:AcrR family transcriptional regulator [Leifsonia sp. AK011]|uniref:TetR/AcrR family transcriptional regulator n=1 Tax=Leifsonia sp. AK011 TaxID=2723075 RepID=UPI0015CDC6A2|nr:TetR/AcrR family transcriptional regulator [Leifsonia sp. AK011]NYF10255.1 AcrR family transcriptional regulator [Leifsonia sp. AK011]